MTLSTALASLADAHKAIETEIAALRRRITSTKQEIETISRAPLPEEEALAKLDGVLAGFDCYAANVHALVSPTAKVGIDDLLLSHYPERTLLWAVARTMRDRLAESIAEYLVDKPAGLPHAAREAKLATLEASLLKLERDEEKLIEHAGAAGIEIMRRVDADPRAVLDIIES